VFFVLISIQSQGIFGVLLFMHIPLALSRSWPRFRWCCCAASSSRDYHVIVRDIQEPTGDLTTTIEEGRAASACSRRSVGARSLRRYDAQATRLYDTNSGGIKLHTKFDGCSASSRTSPSLRYSSPARSLSAGAA